MNSFVFETFEIELQNTLYNLYDPVYTPSPSVLEVLDLGPGDGIEAARRRIMPAIEELKSDSEVPETSKITILYRVLHARFVQSLSQEKAAVQLGLSARHLRRKQNEAIHALAVRAWNKHYSSEKISQGTLNAPEEPPTRATWQESVLHEIQVLTEHSPGVTTVTNQVIQRALEMTAFLRKERPVEVEILSVPDSIQIPIHPNVFRQVVIFVVDQIIRLGYEEKIGLAIYPNEENTRISFYTCIQTLESPLEILHLGELAAVLGGIAEVRKMQDGCSIDLLLPKHQQASVLVVDDNHEVAQLYRRFLANTRYELIHLTTGTELLAQVEYVRPEILVIDVILPDMDGWDLLLQLRQTPATARIPVIISSVMGNEEVALSLGANAYLTKPVDRKTFLATLDRLVQPGKINSENTRLPDSKNL